MTSLLLRRWAVLLLPAAMLCSQTVPFNAVKSDARLRAAVEATQNGAPALTTGIVMKRGSAEPLYSVITYASSADAVRGLGIQPMSFNGRLFTARVTFEQLCRLSNLPEVSRIEAASLRYPKLDKSLAEMNVDQVHAGAVNSTSYTGTGVIVGIIDTGIDWKHQDFRQDGDTTKSRVLFLWDETDTRTGKSPAGYSYGVEYTQSQINDELDGTPAGAVLEQDIAGHGTHVASIAAGDGSSSNGLYRGVAPDADLIIVKAGDNGFPTDNIINGITYIRTKAEALGKPFVINMSLGNHEGAHDGTAADEVTIDAELTGTVGRQVVVAAGNEGSDAIHADSVIAAGATQQLQFTIPSYTPNADKINDYVILDMWYQAGDSLTVTVTTPNSSSLSAHTLQQKTLASNQGTINIFNADQGVDPKNGDRECYIEIYDATAAVTPASGVWTVTIHGDGITDGGAYDIWLASASMDGAEFTSGETYRRLVGMPATEEKCISVGSYVTKWSWKSIDNNTYTYTGADRTGNFSLFSSMGPTRDGRLKPDVSAPGQAIAAAFSTASSFPASNRVGNGTDVIEQGTSMASPHVAGLVALMLQAKPTLTPAEIRSIVNSTARKDAFTGGGATPQWGNGKVDAVAAMQTVLAVEKESDVVPAGFLLRQNFPNPFNPDTRIAFSIPHRSAISLKVYTVLGEEVATLVDETLESGEYSAYFNAPTAASGVYFYTLRSGDFISTKKMMIIR